MPPRGEKHYNWKGGTRKRQNGRISIYSPGHPRADKKGYVFDYILAAEKALGKPLPQGVVVHHHTPEQLVVCQDQGYHLLLHAWQEALAACGHADWRPCVVCGQHDSLDNMKPHGKGAYYHRLCKNEYNKNLYRKNKED